MYASETWAVRAEAEQRLERNEYAMLNGCVALRDEVSTVELKETRGCSAV